MPKETRYKVNAFYSTCCDLIKQLQDLTPEELAEARQWHSFTMSLSEGILEDALITLKEHKNA